MPSVRCANCGFLAVKRRIERTLCEVEGVIRDGGEWPCVASKQHGVYEDVPICYVQASPLSEEMNGKRFLDVIGRDRECPAFTPWQQGLSPKEHADMLHNERMEAIAEGRKRADEERAEQRRGADREWQASQEQTRAERDRERDETARAWQASQNFKNRLLSAFLSALAIVSSIACLFLGKYLNSPPPQPVANQRAVDQKQP